MSDMLLCGYVVAMGVLIVAMAVAMVRHIGNYERTVDRLDERADGVNRSIRALHGLVDAAAEEVVMRLVDGRLAALEASDRLNVVLLRDVEQDVSRVVTIARCATDGATTHAQCALCGKVGHVADMEGMGWEDCLELALDGAPVIKPIPTDAPSHFHPECLVSAGCERVEAVAGGWRRKVVAE